jgi:hypothetical protein
MSDCTRSFASTGDGSDPARSIGRAESQTDPQRSTSPENARRHLAYIRPRSRGRSWQPIHYLQLRS